MAFSRSRIVAVVLTLMNMLLAIPLLMYAYGSFFTRMAYDDFCIEIVARQYGVLGAVGWWYTNWNSRFLALLLNSAASLAGVPALTVYLALLLLVWWGVLFFLFRRVLSGRAYPKLQASLLASLLLVATFASVPNIALTLYWYSGVTMYLTALILFTGCLWLVIQQRFRHAVFVPALCLLLTFMVAGISDLVGLIQFLTLGCLLCACLVRSSPYRYLLPRLIPGLIGSILGLLVVLLAPGNAVRAIFSPAPSISFALQVAVSSLGAPGLIAFQFSPLTTAVVFLVPALATYFAPIPGTFLLKKRARAALLIILAMLFLLTVACFVPVAYFLSVGLVEHAWIIPIFIFLLAFMAWGAAWGLALKPARPLSSVPRLAQGVAIALLAIAAVSGSAQALKAVTRQRSYATVWDARDADIRARVAQGQGTPFSGPFTNPYDARVKVDPAAVPLTVNSLRPVSPFRWEADGDPNTVSNRCIARYYGLSAVIGTP